MRQRVCYTSRVNETVMPLVSLRSTNCILARVPKPS